MNNRSLGVILLCVFLIVYGVLAVTNIEFALSGAILGLLALAAGILIAMGR